MLKLMHYIDMNPVRAGMVSHPREYDWSSYRRYAVRSGNSDLIGMQDDVKGRGRPRIAAAAGAKDLE